MKRAVILGFIAAFLVASPQTSLPQSCGFDEQQQVAYTQVGGTYIPSIGTVRALMIFIDFSDDSYNSSDTTWPVGDGPSYLERIIDEDAGTPSGWQYNVTTFFNDQSFENLHLVGTAIYRQALHSYADYANDNTWRTNIPYWATRHVIEALDEEDFDFSPYDNWTRNGPYDIDPGGDGVIDMIFSCYRYRPSFSNGFLAEGWAHLGGGDNYTVAKDEYTIEAGYPGSGVTVIQMIQYPRLEHVVHEFGHYLGLPHNYSGGLWSLMGHRYPNVSSFMNSYERERLGWITFETISAPDTTTTLADLGYNGDACRIAIPNTNPTQWYYLENHQLLTPYDYVEINGAPGLHILHDNGYGGLQVIAADGRWNWSNPFWILNPWGSGPGDSIPVYKKGTISRSSGYTDKVSIPHSKNGSNLMHAWIDEESSSGQVITFPRYKGEGRDRFTLDYNNVFSPWSGCASNMIGIEITGTPNNNINLKFYPTTPANAPPSKPQGLVVGRYNQYGFYYPHLQWSAMQEPDVVSGGNMEVWRRLKQSGSWGSWQVS